MAASAWVVFARAKHKIGNGTIDLSGGTFRLTFHRTSAALSAGSDISIYSQVGSKSSGGGVATGTGVALAGVTWTTGASLKQQKWDVSDVVVTASNSVLSGVRYAVIRQSAGTTSGLLLCYAALSTSQFNVTTGNTLTIQMATTGVFTLT